MADQADNIAIVETPPDAKHSRINHLTLSCKDIPGVIPCYPTISHSHVSDSVFTNLMETSKMSYCSLSHVEISLPSRPGVGIETLGSHTWVRDAIRMKRSWIECTSLTNIGYTRHVRAMNSVLSNISSITQSKIENSSICGSEEVGEIIDRAQIDGSAIICTEIVRCNLDSVRAERSKLHRSVLQDCDVVDCVILRTQLRGMMLRNAVWKDGKLVGSFGGKEAKVISMIEPPTSEAADSIAVLRSKAEKAAQNALLQGDSGDSDSDSGSHTERGKDKPPSYTT